MAHIRPPKARIRWKTKALTPLTGESPVLGATHSRAFGGGHILGTIYYNATGCPLLMEAVNRTTKMRVYYKGGSGAFSITDRGFSASAEPQFRGAGPMRCHISGVNPYALSRSVALIHAVGKRVLPLFGITEVEGISHNTKLVDRLAKGLGVNAKDYMPTQAEMTSCAAAQDISPVDRRFKPSQVPWKKTVIRF